MHAAALVSGSVALALSTLAAQTSAPLLAAIDGARLIPVAQLRGDQWTAITEAIQPPRTWTRWAPAGETGSVSLAATQPSTGCAPPRAFSIATPQGQNGAMQYAGLASTAPIAHVAATRVPRPADRLVAAIAPIFERRARDHAVSAAALSRVPMTVDVLYMASRAPGAASYYFEASKRLPDAGNTPDEDPRGIVRVAVSGWLREAADRLLPSGSRTELAWDLPDPRAATPAALTPVGVLRQRDELVWVMLDRTRTRPAFILYAVGDSRVREMLRVEGC